MDEHKGGYRLVDWLTQGYLAVVAAGIVLFGPGRLAHWPLYLLAHAVAMALVHGLIRRAEGDGRPAVRFVRAFYPFLLYSFFYSETHLLDDLIVTRHLDGAFIDMDQRLFGRQLCRAMMAAHPQAWVAELLYFAYFSYYVMVFGVGLALYRLRPRRHFRRYVTVLSVVFYVCYLTYIVLPVMGPHGTHVGVVFSGTLASVGPLTAPPSVRSAVFYRIMVRLYDLVEPEGGAAFPSSHVAVALTTLWFTWTHFRKVRLAHLVLVILLCISTVYCGYHYAVDVLGGIVTAALLAPAGLWMVRRAEARQRGSVREGVRVPAAAGAGCGSSDA
ncbi:MAG: phosphatase PAP2 family protein [Candidatus Brocadiaceae bacterium]|nr:phosphatase PAP2 family protein [Candidatus Brocadiaceae bacterium]